MSQFAAIARLEEVMYTSTTFRDAPIAVMDSGVGGLSILRELHRLLPNEDFVFFADQAHVPYGEKTLTQVCEFVSGIARFFMSDERVGDGSGQAISAGEDIGSSLQLSELTLPAKVVVIACNTASAAALHHVRDAFPMIKFIGMEPAVKPAAEHTKTGVIGVIATKATFQGELYASLVDRFAQGIEVQTRACPEFVELTERGGPYDEADQQVITDALKPLVDAGMDQLVLGCTHFPFLEEPIRKSLRAMGVQVDIVDPSGAVARQTMRVLKSADALTTDKHPGNTLYVTSGDPEKLRQRIRDLLHVDTPLVFHAHWNSERPTLNKF